MWQCKRKCQAGKTIFVTCNTQRANLINLQRPQDLIHIKKNDNSKRGKEF